MIYKSLESFSDLNYAYYQNKDRFDCILVSMTIKGVVQLGAFLLGLVVFSSLYTALFFLSGAIIITILIYDVPRVKKLSNKPFSTPCKSDWSYALKLLKKCTPIVIIALTIPLLQVIPRVFFENHYGEELFGKFSSVAAPTIIIIVFLTNALAPLFPRFAICFSNNDHLGFCKLLLTSVGIMMVFGAVAMVISIYAGEWGLVILYGEGIRPYANLLNSIVITTILSSLIACFQVMFIAVRKLFSLALVLILSCIICYFITPYFINSYGMHGVAYAILVSQLATTFILILLFIHLLVKMCKLDRTKTA